MKLFGVTDKERTGESGTVLLKVDELIQPNRLDIEIRIDFLRQLDDGRLNVSETPYFLFVSERRGLGRKYDGFKAARRFRSLYEKIRKNGYPLKASKWQYIQVVDLGSPHNVYIPPDRKNATMSIQRKYELYDGAHRLSIIKHLGREEVECEVVTGEAGFRPSDYTSYILQSEYGKQWWNQHIMNKSRPQDI